MKNILFKGLIVAGLALTAIFTVSITNVSAKSVFENYSAETYSDEVTIDESYSLEEMLVYAIQDEYLAKAEYEAIIATFGEVTPFTNIVLAEQTHIDMLLPLFATYEIEVPVNTAADSVVIPDSITSALATGVEAEEVNIAMYVTFLAQDNLPDDVRAVFEYLMSASENHLQAFSQDRNSYIGEDLMNQFKKQWKKAFGGDSSQNGEGNQYKGTNGQGNQESQASGQGNQNSGSKGNDGNCTN